ncbi:hypothetical protein INR49_007985 [Caranx melampygus]|nr:hypothetical protein INR49_007985 [Caranx melampygus]
MKLCDVQRSRNVSGTFRTLFLKLRCFLLITAAAPDVDSSHGAQVRLSWIWGLRQNLVQVLVELATCHHCPVVSSRRGLIYRDSLSALSRNLRAPGAPPPPWPLSPRLHERHHCRLTRADLPESIALARSKPSGSMKHLVLAHLRKLLTLSPAHQRGLHLPV